MAPRLITLSGEQLALRAVTTTLASCIAKPCAVEADHPRLAPSKRVTGAALTETNPPPTFRLSPRGHRRIGSEPTVRCRACS